MSGFRGPGTIRRTVTSSKMTPYVSQELDLGLGYPFTDTNLVGDTDISLQRASLKQQLQDPWKPPTTTGLLRPTVIDLKVLITTHTNRYPNLRNTKIYFYCYQNSRVDKSCCDDMRVTMNANVCVSMRSNDLKLKNDLLEVSSIPCWTSIVIKYLT